MLPSSYALQISNNARLRNRSTIAASQSRGHCLLVVYDRNERILAFLSLHAELAEYLPDKK